MSREDVLTPRCVHVLCCISFLILLALPRVTFAQAGNFAAPVNYTIPGIAQGIAVGAFISSKPNVPDIAVATQNANVSILLGNGDGTLQAQYTEQAVPSTGPYSTYLTRAVAVGDFNGDGNLDLAVLCNNPQSPTGPPVTIQGAIIILLGDGTGQFTPQTPIALEGANPDQILAAKFDTNNNSNIDLAVLNEASNSFTILLGNGDGTFTALPDTSIELPLMEMAAADFNKDGKLDLAIGDYYGVAVLLGNGDGTFQAMENWALPGEGDPLAIGDFNGDGNLDIATAGGGIDGTGLNVLLGQGDGTFQSPAIGSRLLLSASYLVAGDFNSDGKLDVAASGSAPDPNNLQFYLGNGDGTFSVDAFTTAGITYAGGSGSGIYQVIVADLNGDGFPDLVAMGEGANNAGANVSVLLNCGLLCTATTAASSTTTSVSGQPVTFTATVTLANAKATGTPTGTVIFQAATVPYALGGGSPVTTTLGSATLSGAVAILTTSSLAVGQYMISANYQGDSNFNSSSSIAEPSQLQQNVELASATTSVSSSSDPSGPGQSVTLTSTVTAVAPGSGVPTGVVTFSANGNPLAAQPLNASGVATFMTSSLATGTDSITALYSGDSNFGSSTSSAMTQIVGSNAAPFAVSASPASATVSAGGSATFTIAAATVPSLTSKISLICQGLPMGASCRFSPAQITPKGASATTTLTISTTGSGSVFDPFPGSPRLPSPALPFAFLSLLALVMLALTRKQQTQKAVAALVLLWIFVVLTGVVACGGNSSRSMPPVNVTPSGTSQITVMASTSGNSQTTKVSLTVN